MTSSVSPSGTGQDNTAGRWSLILGILGIPTFLFIYFGIPLGVAAVVLGVRGINRCTRGRASNRGQAIVGLVCGTIALTLTLAHIALRVVESLR